MEFLIPFLIALFYGLLFIGSIIILIFKIAERIEEKQEEKEKKDELDQY